MRLQMPTKLDDPMKFLFWEFDDLIIFFVLVFAGAIFNAVFVYLVIGAICAVAWSRFKSGKQKYFHVTLIYWFTPMNSGSSRIPQTAEREFLR